MRKLASLVALIALMGCGAGIKDAGDGTLRLECDTVLSTCMRRAEAHCRKDGGVHLLSARETNELYGVEGNQAGTLASELRFVCNSDAPRAPIKLPPRPAETAPETTGGGAVAPASAEPEPMRPAKRLCVPGSTQRCVGPGACVGGQACLPDGSGFAACDCGPASVDAGADASAGAHDAGLDSDAGQRAATDAGAPR